MRFTLSHVFLAFLCFASITWVQSYENYELDLFDLVEDVKVNFYDMLGVRQVTKSEICHLKVYLKRKLNSF
jgi:hypothetical protein